MNLIPIKNEKRKINGTEIDVFIVPALLLTQGEGREKKIPHPDGQDIIIFKSMDEAKQAINLSGFSYSMHNSDNRLKLPKVENNNDLNNIINPLINLLKDKSLDVISAAAYSLGETGSSDAIPHLIDLLGKDDITVRKSCIEALAKIGNPALPLIIKAMDDQNWVTRNSAAQCIAEMSEYKNINLISTVNPLINELQDNNSIVRSTAAIALGKVYKNLKRQNLK